MARTTASRLSCMSRGDEPAHQRTLKSTELELKVDANTSIGLSLFTPFDCIHRLANDACGFVQIGVVGYAGDDLVPAAAIIRQYLDRVLEQHRIGDKCDFARQFAHIGFAQGDMFDLAGDPFAHDNVADTHFLGAA